MPVLSSGRETERKRSDGDTSSDASRSPGEAQRRGGLLFLSLSFSSPACEIPWTRTRGRLALKLAHHPTLLTAAQTHSVVNARSCPQDRRGAAGRKGRRNLHFSLARIPRHLTAAGRSPCSSGAKGTRQRHERADTRSLRVISDDAQGGETWSLARATSANVQRRSYARVVETTRGASSFCVLKRPSARRGPGIVSVDRNVRSKCRCSCVLQFTS